MAEGVRKSFKKTFIRELNKAVQYLKNADTHEILQRVEYIDFDRCRYTENRDSRVVRYLADILGATLPQNKIRDLYNNVCADVEEETHQAMEALVFNFNSLHCLPYDEKFLVYYCQEDEVKTIMIGEFEKIFEPNRFKTLSVNKETGACEHKFITAVKKQDNHRKLVTLIAETGQKVTVTDNHKIMTLSADGNIVEDFPDNIQNILVPKIITEDDEMVQYLGFNLETLNSYPKRGDVIAVPVKSRRYSESGEDYVYDISVADSENFLTADYIFVHNSRAGSQVPFSSINFGMDTSQEGRLVSKEFLQALWNGLGRGETSIFPISIYQLKKGVNYNEGDPNYDIFKMAMKVSARRLFPNFLSLDASFNLPYYREGDYNSYVSSMGCAAGDELIVYVYKGLTYVDSIASLWTRMTETVHTKGVSEYRVPFRLSVWDASENRFVDVYTVIKNPDHHNRMRITLSNGHCITVTADHPLYTVNRGRIFADDLKIGDQIETYFGMPPASNDDGKCYGTPEYYYLQGLRLAKNTKFEFTVDDIPKNLADNVGNILSKLFGNDFGKEYLEPYRISAVGRYTFEERNHADKHIPANVFSAPRFARLAYLAGFIDGDGGISHDGMVTIKCPKQKTFALQLVALIQGLGYPAKYILDTDYTITSEQIGYEIAKYRCNPEEKYRISDYVKYRSQSETEIAAVTNIECLDDVNMSSYDLETASDKFTLSFVNSGNCRTRVMSNVNGAEQSGSRGNFAFVTINLPQLALESRRRGNSQEEITGIFRELYDKYINLAKEYLEYRFEIIAHKKVKNFPFIMGQKIYLGSENLEPEDEIRPALLNSTLSIGFCGLVECLVALTGKHHGESEHAQQLGLKIVKHLRDMTDKFTAETHMNWSTFSTPAESTAGSFLKATRKRYGVIKGVTDKEYFTNSFHVKPSYKISAFDKIRIEAPYHALCNAGHISYIEYDGDPLKNLTAFETLIRAMVENDMGYIAVNHKVDRDPVCGYTGIIENECPHCKRREHEKHKHTKLKLGDDNYANRIE